MIDHENHSCLFQDDIKPNLPGLIFGKTFPMASLFLLLRRSIELSTGSNEFL
jgi:hypothetical protein